MPYAIYYICIIVYLDSGIRLIVRMRKRDGYLASDPILEHLCQLLNGELTELIAHLNGFQFSDVRK